MTDIPKPPWVGVWVLGGLRGSRYLADAPQLRRPQLYRARYLPLGWWDRNPTSLHPAPPASAGAELAAAITDKAALIRHAEALAGRGEHQRALHVIDALAAAPGDAPELAQARQLKAAWLRERAGQVRSYVSRSIYLGCADRIEAGTAAEFGMR